MTNVKAMYDITKAREVPLLSNYSSTFWSEYVAHFDEFDNVFKTLFKTFNYFDQEDDDSALEVTMNFIEIVKGWLRMNDKRYNELWRVNVIDDNKYGILNDYDITENYQGLDTIAASNKEGARTDVRDFTEGSQNSENQGRNFKGILYFVSNHKLLEELVKRYQLREAIKETTAGITPGDTEQILEEAKPGKIPEIN